MSLKLYTLYESDSIFYCKDAYVKLKRKNMNKDRIFRITKESIERIKKNEISFYTSASFTLNNIVTTDFIDFPSAPLFSSNFAEKMKEDLKEEIEFIPCILMCENTKLQWYIGNVTKKMEVIDLDKSTFSYLDEDTKLLKELIYKNDITERFYITKDKNYPTRLVVSDLFKDLCESHNLFINFEEVTS